MNDRKTPRIRFKGFTDDWEQRKLGEIVGIYDGVHQTPNYQNSGVMFLSVENIATLKSLKFISEEDFKRDYKVFPQEKDILMTRIGDVGTTNVVTDNGLKAYYVSLALLKYKSTDPYFLSNAIQSDYVQKGLANRTLKTAIPMKINKDEIGKVSVMLPLSATEQQQIGTYFRNLDHLITLHQRKLEKLKIIKKAMLENCFPKNGEKVPKFRFSGFTGDWEQRKFEDITFPAGEKNKDNIAYESYSVTNENGFVPQNEQFENGGTMATANKSMYYIVSRNSFAYNPARINVGSIGYYDKPENVIVSSLYEVFKTIEDIDDRFLWHWFKSNAFQKMIEQYQEGGVRLYFYYDKLCMCSLPIPDIKEQRKIGKQLDEIDHLITLHQRKLEKLKIIKKSFLEKMFV